MKKIILGLTFLATTSCGSLAAGYNSDGYLVSCNGDGCSKFTEYAATLISETKLESPKDSPFFTVQKERAEKKTWIENIFRRGE